MIESSLSDPDIHGTIRVISAAATDVGHVRATNEDSILDDSPIFLVADGMGGHNAGEVASAIAVEEFEKLTVQENVTVEQLGDALRTAAERIADLGGEAQLGAGTTVAVVATMVLDGVGYWVVLNLGDSRVYRLSGEIFEQVSVDHSVVQELMDRGELTAEEARTHPYRHMVTRALGAGPETDPDYWLIPAEVGDRMLCAPTASPARSPTPRSSGCCAARRTSAPSPVRWWISPSRGEAVTTSAWWWSRPWRSPGCRPRTRSPLIPGGPGTRTCLSMRTPCRGRCPVRAARTDE